MILSLAPDAAPQSAQAFKLQHIFLPAALLSLAFCAVYSTFNWFLVAGSGIVPLDPMVSDVWLPLAFGWALELALIQRWVSTLRGGTNLRPLYHLIAVTAVVAPALFAQNYISNIAGGTTHLASSAQIASAGGNRFIVADRICMDSANAAAMANSNLTGDNNENLEMHIRLAAPVCGTANAWIAFGYERTVDNSLPEADKSAAFNGFRSKTGATFDRENPRRYRYLERMRPGAEKRAFEDTIREGKRDPAGALIFVSHTDALDDRAGNGLLLTFASLAGSLLALFAMLMLAPLDEDKRQNLAAPKPAGEAKGNLLALIIPRRTYYGLPILLDINVLVFLAMVFTGLGFISFDTDDLLAWGANYAPYEHGLGLFRLISAQFIHDGIMHLVNNMYGLLFTSIFLFPIALNSRLIACYLITGIGGNIASAWWHPDVVGVGASGAIFGLCGTLLTLLLLRDPRLEKVRSWMLTNTAIFAGINLMLGAASPNIDNAAHVGGLLTGAVMGAGFYFMDRRWPPPPGSILQIHDETETPV